MSSQTDVSKNIPLQQNCLQSNLVPLLMFSNEAVGPSWQSFTLTGEHWCDIIPSQRQSAPSGKRGIRWIVIGDRKTGEKTGMTSEQIRSGVFYLISEKKNRRRTDSEACRENGSREERAERMGKWTDEWEHVGWVLPKEPRKEVRLRKHAVFGSCWSYSGPRRAWNTI